jgi:hypothetical protein
MYSLDAPRRAPRRPLARTSLPWVHVAAGAPYFVTDDGAAWTPVGQNDAIAWPDLAGAFRRRDLGAVDRYLATLAAHGVTCVRLMLEYCHREHRYLERPAGRFVPAMVRLWDDLLALLERHRLRALLTPYDTFFMWTRWGRHPYNRRNGGPCARRSHWLLCADTRRAIKGRLAFATERWGGSGAVFAWDLWNEIHPAQAGGSAEGLADFVADVGDFLRGEELRLHGRAHPQTVSVFGPTLALDPRVAECAFRHPALQFATVHFYEHGTIDDPRNTVDAALSVGRLVGEAVAQTPRERPFFDSEHGPIHTFKDRRRTLPEPFDDEYFRHIQWAHFASGGAGGGMRWPNRHPHSLTAGMRAAQRALSAFLPMIAWSCFRRRNLSAEVRVESPALRAFACGDEAQAVAWLLRIDAVGRDGMLRRNVAPLCTRVAFPGLAPSRYRVTAWDTAAGRPVAEWHHDHHGHGPLTLDTPPIRADLALAVCRG